MEISLSVKYDMKISNSEFVTRRRGGSNATNRHEVFNAIGCPLGSTCDCGAV